MLFLLTIVDDQFIFDKVIVDKTLNKMRDYTILCSKCPFFFLKGYFRI